MSLSVDSPPKLAGKKRKHSLAVEEDPHVKLTGKLHHYLKEVRKAAKKSKTFETQRLVKKLKDLRKITHVGTVLEEIVDLEAQLESLKRTDHGRIAYLALSSKIRKDKILTSNNTLMTSLASAMSISSNANIGATHVKVESRLLSSKVLAAEAQEAVKGLRAVLSPDMTPKAHSDVRPLKGAIDDQGDDEDNEKKVAIDASVLSMSADDRSDESDIDELGDAHTMVDADGWESGSVDDIQHTGSDDDDDDDDIESSSPRKKTKTKEPSLLGSLDPSSTVAASTFLPSLSVGYIKGDSDSDTDPSDGDTAKNGRKNRRGQRARQAIWEKKYGKNAKHVKKQREDRQAIATARSLGKRTDKGWDGRRHGDSEPASVSVREAGTKRLVRGRAQRDSHLLPEKPTHPSWEAKRKLKEKEGARILPSKGKKIVFT